MSGFNNSETDHVTFDPMSINASEKSRFYCQHFIVKQHDIGQEVLPMQLLLIHWKTAHMDFMHRWEMTKDERKLNNSDISNAPVLYDRYKTA